MASDHWAFLQAFLKSPRIVASVAPSSPFLERRIARLVDPAATRIVVEFGAGTGGTTKALLNVLPPDAQLLSIECTDAFVEHTRRIRDPRLTVVHGCASSIEEVLHESGHREADAVVSGIPFSCLPGELAEGIVAAVYKVLSAGGRFVAYQVTDSVVSYVRPVIGEPEVEHELWNVPPVRVFTWRKQGRVDGHPARGSLRYS